MRKKTAFRAIFTIALGVGLVGCNNSKNYKNSSRATGWSINSKDGGFQYDTDYKEQEPAPGLVFIEGGTFTMGQVQDDVMHDWNNTPTQQHIQSFYMDETEVTNRMYLEYLDWLKRVFPPSEQNYRNIYYGALPDTLVWRNRLGYNETMVNNYLRHPAYGEYPVVGVSWVQAAEFSKWRTDRVNEKQLVDAGYISEETLYKTDAGATFSTETYINAPSRVYGGNTEMTQSGKTSQKLAQNNTTTQTDPQGNTVTTSSGKKQYVQRKDGILYPEYRLPTEAEWEYAALGLVGIRDYNIYRGRKKYPWDGRYTRSGDLRKQGDQLANFKQGAGDYGGIAGWSDDGADITAPVMSYEANDFGLYDMAGNVAEWVADVYRPIVDDEFNDFNYYRGNVYTENAINEDGTVQVVGVDNIKYDTLSTGRVVARNLPGEILQKPITEDETYMRTNFSKSDNRDFRDGDKSSSRYYQPFQDTDNSKRMYNSPDFDRLAIGDTTQAKPKYDDKERTTLISDDVRVYKGGSWKDRAYWLDPAQRRFLPQDMATDYIGFRNAMSKVGAKSMDNVKRARSN
ncbi:gliding motility lipoprotein GldJ [Zunongwangia profunda]|jgi:gliding motility-associated lipoprotein GldJ|uniref:gliding motility lipoprotein GldJ n=2 Tax=Zunongwangia profunda TaxID=398743 RepID=UPI001D188C43|nr:gliding motility lipoprotein GldJ [Zunongwangia profunda]MCC4230822.1 gliding motility lipoprotein GldJ [Zunongwangia profunda]|tara:strand:- start:1603 stop:3306 length:1704 start_codon:yes stop_codon:yes gene_type:complete